MRLSGMSLGVHAFVADRILMFSQASMQEWVQTGTSMQVVLTLDLTVASQPVPGCACKPNSET